jgi:hypothetical protein
MADSAMMNCPTCRNLGRITGNTALLAVELMRDMDMIRCSNGHTFPNYNELMAMNPDLIKMAPQDKRQPTDVKVEFWIDGTVYEKYRLKYPLSQNANVESILRLFILEEEPVIIDGSQAKELRKRSIRNGQEMLAALSSSGELQTEIDGLKTEIKTLRGMLKQQLKDDEGEAE